MHWSYVSFPLSHQLALELCLFCIKAIDMGIVVVKESNITQVEHSHMHTIVLHGQCCKMGPVKCTSQHIKATNIWWLPFGRWHFQRHFLIFLNGNNGFLAQFSLKFAPEDPCDSIGLSNNFVPSRWQTITWTKVDQDFWCHIASLLSLDHNELKSWAFLNFIVYFKQKWILLYAEFVMAKIRWRKCFFNHKVFPRIPSSL